MPTLLVTRKMSPQLAARVQASVDGRRRTSGSRLAPRSISFLRLALFATLLVALVWFALSRQRARQKVEVDRSALLERARRESASLTDVEKAIGSRVLPWLTRAAGKYEGDSIASELRPKGALGRALARRTVYVRGSLASFADPARIVESTSASFKDAFVLCLVDPPASRTEKLLRAKARAAYGGLDRTQPGAQIERLHDAFEGLPFLAPEFETRVIAARDRRELDKLRRAWQRAPIEGAKRAAKAELLLFAIDEPGDGRGPTELDGERPHEIRVGLVDLAGGKLLLRLRKRVDPSWISAATRAEYASGIDSCALALDVHAAVSS